MNMMHFMRQEMRTKHIKLMCLTLFLAISFISAINFFIARVENAFLYEKSAVIGADLILQSNYPVNLWHELLPFVDKTVVLNFSTMAEFHHRLQLIRVKALTEPYPLRGKIWISANKNQPAEAINHIPPLNEIWVDQKLLWQLGTKIGESIHIGATQFKITGLVTSQPDYYQDWLDFSPAVLMNAQNLPATKIIGLGSRVFYQYLFAGNESVIDKLTNTFSANLSAGKQIITAKNGGGQLQNFQDRYEKYLRLSMILALLLIGATLSLACRHFTNRQMRTVALYECLGATSNTILRLYIGALLVISSVIIIGGMLSGYLLQFIFQNFAVHFFKTSLPYAINWPSLLGSLSIGYLLVFGFMLPPLFALKSVPALNVLRREILHQVTHQRISLIIFMITMSLLVLVLSQNIVLGKIFIISILIMFASIFSMIYLIFYGIFYLKKFSKGVVQYALMNMVRIRWLSCLQITSIAITFLAALLVYEIRTNLLGSFENKISAHAPNYFIVNIQPDQVNQIKSYLNSVKQKIQSVIISEFYPIVRGRLIAKNSVPILNTLSGLARDDNSLKRDLNLSWNNVLPDDNIITTGIYNQNINVPQVSVEGNLAKRLNLAINDVLTFQIADETVSAKITSLRYVDWNSFKPNFFYLFSEKVLNNFPYTYIASFYLPTTASNYLADLVYHFPSITLIEITQILNEVKKIFNHLSIFTHYILLMTYCAAALILIAVVQLNFAQRKLEASLLRTLGASSTQLCQAILIEYFLMGLIAGLVAFAGAILMEWILTTWVFALPFSIHFNNLWITCLSSAFLTTLLGYIALRPIMNISPLRKLAVNAY
jgi:putative ABC transport system permease protein